MSCVFEVQACRPAQGGPPADAEAAAAPGEAGRVHRGPERAYATLTKAGGEGKYEEFSPEKALAMLQKAVAKHVRGAPSAPGESIAKEIT